MSLDFALLNADGSPEESVAFDVDTHHALVRAAERLRLQSVLRFREYYEDAEAGPEDLPGLAQALRAVRAGTESGSLLRAIDALDKLIGLAIERGATLHAIAD